MRLLPLRRVFLRLRNRADPFGATGWSGTAMTHACTPVPARTRDPFRHIWLRAPHFRHLSVQWAGAPHTHAPTPPPMSQYPVCPSSSITNNTRWKSASKKRAITPCPTFFYYFFSYVQFRSAQKYSVQILVFFQV